MKNSSNHIAAWNELAGRQKKILLLIQSELAREKNACFSFDFINSYKNLKQEFYIVARKHFLSTHCDFQGEAIFKDSSIVVEVTENSELFPSIQFSDHEAKINIPLNYCLVLDLYTFCFSKIEKDDDQPSKILNFDIYLQILFECFNEYIEEYLSENLNAVLKYQNWQIDWSAAICACTSLSILYHEIGHFAVGHTRYYYHKKVNPNGMTSGHEIHYSEQVRQLSSNDAYERWMAELTADSYAMIRLYIFLDGWREPLQETFRNIPAMYQSIHLPIRACCLPLILSELTKYSSAETSSKRSSAHPGLKVRELNIFSTLYFCMFPTPNQWLDIRKTELTNTYYAKDYDPGETNVREHEAQSRRVDYSIALEIDDYIHEFSRNGLRRQDHDGLYVPKVLFASKASKYGTYLPMADVNSMLIDKHLSFFGELWKQMSGGLNAKLSQGMQPMWFKCYDDIPDDQIYTVASHSESERLIAKKGLLTMNLIRDPVFKIIDDWMSSLYRYHPENELNDLQEYRLPFLELMANEVIVTGQLSNFYRI